MATLRDGVDELLLEIEEVEKHVHNYERWLGAAASATSGTHVADDDSMTAFQADAGNDQWGAWVQVLGSTDTPVTVGMAKYDLHRILVTTLERTTALHRMQIGFGTSGAAALAAGEYLEFAFKPTAANLRTTPVDVLDERVSTTTLAWVRVWADGGNTGTVDFLIGLHEYPR